MNLLSPRVFELLVVDAMPKIQNLEMSQDALEILQSATEQHLIEYFRDLKRISDRNQEDRGDVVLQRCRDVLERMTGCTEVPNAKFRRVF